MPKQSAASTPRVSVALCTHNGERFIAQQLQSILQQSLPVSEIVVGDDDSTDATLEIVEQIAAETDIPVRVRRHTPALGVAANFADAIVATTGDVVAFSDQDDVWHADRIERLLTALDGVAMVHSDADLVDESGVKTGATLAETLDMSDEERRRMQHGGAFEALLRRNLVTGATAIVRRDAAVAALPVPAGWIHDEWIAMCCALSGGVRFVPDSTIDYRQHGSNAIGVRRLSLAGKFKRLIESDSGSHARKALRAASLLGEAMRRRLGTPDQRAKIAAKARHERDRAALPDPRILRVPTIMRGVLRGRYRLYSRGPLDVGRDLLESH